MQARRRRDPRPRRPEAAPAWPYAVAATLGLVAVFALIGRGERPRPPVAARVAPASTARPVAPPPVVRAPVKPRVVEVIRVREAEPVDDEPPALREEAPPPQPAREDPSTTLLSQATEFVNRGELASARVLLDRIPGEAAARVQERIRRREGTPAGMVFVETDPVTARGFYARRAPVTNGDYLGWIERLPLGKRGSVTLPPRTAAARGPALNDPVLRLRIADAEAFAASHGERLPTAEERAAIASALGVTEEAPSASGVLAGGFRTVRDP